MKRFSMFACALLIASAFSAPSMAAFEIGTAVSAQDYTFAAYDLGPLAAVVSVGDAQAASLAHAERERVSYLSDSAVSHDALCKVGAYVAAAPLAVGGWPS